jgi:SAM-dependent methyltransferase
MNTASKSHQLVHLNRVENELWTEPVLDHLDVDILEDQQGPVLMGKATGRSVAKLGELYDSSDRVVCIHPSEDFVNYLREQFREDSYPSQTYIVQQSPDQLNYREERFDASLYLNELFARDVLLRRMAALRRVTKKGGQVVAAVFLEDSFDFFYDILTDVAGVDFTDRECEQIVELVQMEFVDRDHLFEVQGIEPVSKQICRWSVGFADGNTFLNNTFTQRYFLGQVRAALDKAGLDIWGSIYEAIQTYWGEAPLQTDIAAGILYGECSR